MTEKTFYPNKLSEKVDIRHRGVATASADLMMCEVYPATRQTDVKTPHKEDW
jgi:hypothetical protein